MHAEFSEENAYLVEQKPISFYPNKFRTRQNRTSKEVIKLSNLAKYKNIFTTDSIYLHFKSDFSSILSYPINVEENLSEDDYSSEINLNSFRLNQNYPNPFNPSTTINYTLAESGFVNLIVTDLLGNEIMTLVNEMQGDGAHQILFDGSDLPSGVYIYRLQIDGFTDSKKMILAK